MSFNAFPREIRDSIYSHHSPIYPAIKFSKMNKIPDTALPFLARHLPHCLLLNHQVVEEVTSRYLARSKNVIGESVLAVVERIFDLIGHGAGWKNTRELEFTSNQQVYANGNEPSTMFAPAKIVHEIAIRCSNLRKVSIAFARDALITPTDAEASWSHSCRRPVAPHVFEHRTHLTLVLENNNLIQVTFFYNLMDSGWQAMRVDCKRTLGESTALFKDAAGIDGRRLDVLTSVMMPTCRVTRGGGLSSDHPLA